MPEISKTLSNSLRRIQKRGGVVLVHHGIQGGASLYQLQDGGEVAPKTVQRLIDAGKLQSNHDGLFDGTEQSFRVVSA